MNPPAFFTRPRCHTPKFLIYQIAGRAFVVGPGRKLGSHERRCRQVRFCSAFYNLNKDLAPTPVPELEVSFGRTPSRYLLTGRVWRLTFTTPRGSNSLVLFYRRSLVIWSKPTPCFSTHHSVHHRLNKERGGHESGVRNERSEAAFINRRVGRRGITPFVQVSHPPRCVWCLLERRRL